MNWFPLHCHDHFSILDGLSKPAQIAERIVECGYDGCAITNHGSISGAFAFQQALLKANKKNILGCEFYLSKQEPTVKDESNRKLTHLCVLAKNLTGWKDLIRAVSLSNAPEHFYHKPRLHLNNLKSLCTGNWFAFSGHPGSDLADCIFENPKLAYNINVYDEVRKLVHPKWKERVIEQIKLYQETFGKDNFFLEIQLIDQDNIPAALVIGRILRKIGDELGVPRVATADSHYPRKEDAADHRILLCSSLKVTKKEIEKKLENEEDIGLGGFFRSSNYHIPSLNEMQAIHTDDELENSLKIAAACENYSISGKPLLPEFPCPDNLKPNEYLWKLCQDGWNKISNKVPAEQHKIYLDRLDMEYKVLSGAGLSSYFLMVQDYITYAKDVLKCRVGKGRGSAAGCLVSYLSGITGVDPIRFNLLFERFYNSGRNTKDRIAFPDIDSDFPVSYRDKVVEYIEQKFGEDKVGHIATFGRMQGRGAIKDVLRAHGSVEFSEMNRITQFIPDESKIADDLQDMLDEFGDSSIIRWALENNPEQLREWCWIKETINDGKDVVLDGPLQIEFGQAIRMEGTYRSQGKHASGIIVSSIPITDVAPMVYDSKSKSQLVGVDMRDAEQMGLIKVDILGLLALDRIMGAEKLIRTGHL